MGTWQMVLEILVAVYMASVIILNTKKGFAKTFLEGLKSIAIILLATLLTPLFSGMCSDYLVSGWFEGTITPSFVETAEQAGDNFNIETIMESLPAETKDVMAVIDVETLADDLSGVELANELGGRLEGFITGIVSYIITYIVISILLTIIISIAFKAIEKVVEIPVLKNLNRLLGFAWGIISAYIQMSVIMFFISMFMGSEFLEGTYISGFIYEYGLLSMFNNLVK